MKFKQFINENNLAQKNSIINDILKNFPVKPIWGIYHQKKADRYVVFVSNMPMSKYGVFKKFKQTIIDKYKLEGKNPLAVVDMLPSEKSYDLLWQERE